MQPKMLQTLTQAGMASARAVVANVATDILTYHTFPEEAARIARDANVRHLVLFHIIPAMPASILHSTFLGDSRKYYQGPITIGMDGMLFSMPPNSTEILEKWIISWIWGEFRSSRRKKKDSRAVEHNRALRTRF
jgi:ribonuclease Z